MSNTEAGDDASKSAFFERPSGCPKSRRSSKALPPDAIEALRRSIAGRIVLPGDSDYDQARKLANARFDPYPSAIVFCTAEHDVRACLSALKQFAVSFRIRAGGHSTAGYSASDDVVIDVSGLNSVSIDKVAQTALVGAGCTVQSLRANLDPLGLHVPGEPNKIGIGGFVQGGGWGLTSRIFGMNCDSADEVRVMLADGRIVRANRASNHDLWWAVRGGTGGNFGVLLTVQYRLRPLGELMFWKVSWPLPKKAGWDNQVAGLATMQRCFTGPGASEVGAAAGINIEGSPPMPTLWIMGFYAGTRPAAEAALKPLFDIPSSTKTLEQVTSFPRLGDLLTIDPMATAITGTERAFAASNPPSHRKSRFVSREVDQAEWHRIIEYVLASPTPYSEFQIHCYGGAIDAYPGELSAFIHRHTSFSCYLLARWQTTEQQRLAAAYLDDWCTLMEPYWDGGIYQNFPSEDYQDYRWNYWGVVFPALLKVKHKYDPDGFFAFPQMVSSAENAPIISPPLVAKALHEDIIFDG